jgi:hypothetical protein
LSHSPVTLQSSPGQRKQADHPHISETKAISK